MAFIVLREGIDNNIPIHAGDDVIVYRLADDDAWLSPNLAPHSGCDKELVEYMTEAEQEFATASETGLWREESALFCSGCPRPRSRRDRGPRKLVSVLIHTPTGRRWVSARPERRLGQHRKAERVEAYPMHGGEGERPHVGGATSCPGCKRKWLVLSDSSAVRLVEILETRFGARVQP